MTSRERKYSTLDRSIGASGSVNWWKEKCI